MRTAPAQAANLAAAIAAQLADGAEPAAAGEPGGLRRHARPYPMYAQLAQHKLDWSRVQITLADERWVATDHADSNERQVRASLLRHDAAAARFIGLKNDATRPADGAAAAWAALAGDATAVRCRGAGHGGGRPRGLAVSRAAPNWPAGLDAQARPACIAVQPSTAAHARLSLNLAALLQSRHIFIQIIGALKWRVYEKARGAGALRTCRFARSCGRARVPVDVYWCPDSPAEETISP